MLHGGGHGGTVWHDTTHLLLISKKKKKKQWYDKTCRDQHRVQHHMTSLYRSVCASLGETT